MSKKELPEKLEIKTYKIEEGYTFFDLIKDMTEQIATVKKQNNALIDYLTQEKGQKV